MTQNELQFVGKSKLEPPVTFGEWVQQRRKMLDLTQNELADRAGCSVYALRKIESGERRPSKQLAGLLADALNISPDNRQTFVRVARGELNLERLQPPGAPQDTSYHPKHSGSPTSTNLPQPSTPLVGRENEINLLQRLLIDPQCRLLTLTGPGGIGKTRLAIEVASRSKHQYIDGVFFVPLAALNSSEFIIPHIADALGFTFQGQAELRTQLFSHLSGKNLLIVLDNTEHLLECAGLFNEMLEHSPGLKLIVTSRERLQLQSEWVFEIQGLPVPPRDLDVNLADYSSAALFIQNARRVKFNFEVSAEDRYAIITICRLLEGMPLGIELAASWVSILSCKEIAHEIERSMDFLATNLRDLPERQRSMRAVFDHSWRLLSKDERQALARLAIFQGGFVREAAEEIVGATLPVLMTLITKSLVRRKANGRFDLHDVIRQYASSHLAEDPFNQTVHERYSNYYLSLLLKNETALIGPAQHDAIRELTDEISNIRAAWTWKIQQEKFSLIGQVIRSYAWLCNLAGWLQEGIDQLELVVNALRLNHHDNERQKILGVALAWEGLLYFRKGDFKGALSLYEESLTVLRPLGEPDALSGPLIYCGVILHLTGEYGSSKTLLEEGLQCAQDSGQRWNEAYALFNLGYLDSLLGNIEEGYLKMSAGLNTWRELGDPSSTALGLNHINHTLVQLGKLDEAEANLQESIMLCEQVGDRWGLGTANRYMGEVKIAQGDLNEAISYIQKSLDLFNGFNVGWDIVKSLIYLGNVKVAAGEFEEARRTYTETLPMAMEAVAPPLVLDIFVGLAHLYILSGDFELAFKLSQFTLNHHASAASTKVGASQLAKQACNELHREVIDKIQKEIQSKSLESLIEEVLSISRT